MLSTLSLAAFARLSSALLIAVVLQSCTAAQIRALSEALQRDRPTASEASRSPNHVDATPRMETGAPLGSEERDHCGPTWLQERFPAWLAFSVQEAIAHDLRPACQRHDACYRLRQVNQQICDRRFLADMKHLCDTRHPKGLFGVARGLCHWKAVLFYNAVASTWGALSYGGGEIGGKIVSHRAFVTRDLLSDDEVTACVVVENPTDRVLEYDVQMYSADGRLIDTEPDTYEVNVQSHGFHEFCVGTNLSPLWSYRDVGRQYHIVVRLDDPDTMKFWGDWIIVDQGTYPRPPR